MPHLSSDDLLARLHVLGLMTTTHRHDPVFTVAESASVKASIPGAHSKNLFLKDRKGSLFLIVAKDDTAIDLRELGRLLGASGRLSFGSADLLRSVLGVEPGSVTPFAAANDCAGLVTVVLDARLMNHDRMNFHPLVNTMTTGLSGPDLLTFLRAAGHEPSVVALPGPAVDCTAVPERPSP